MYHDFKLWKEKRSEAEPSLLGNPLRHKLVEDLAVMQNMVCEGLELARSMDSAEKMQRIQCSTVRVPMRLMLVRM